MDLMTSLWLLLVLITAIAVATSVVIYSYKKRQKQSAADEARRKAIEEQSREVEQESVRRAEEEEQQRAEAEGRWLEEESGSLGIAVANACSLPDIVFGNSYTTTGGVNESKRCYPSRQFPENQESQRAEEEHRKSEEIQEVEEEPRREEEAKPKVQEEERLKAEAEGKRVEPGKRGGRSRASTKAQEEQLTQKTKSRRPKPEIVCWKREWQWIPAVEVPEELFESPNLAVLQNGLPLTQDESREGCWHLKEAYGQVIVQWKEDEVAREIEIALGEESYLLFKLSGQDQNQGRRVKSPSSGSYLVMVPDNWERDDTLSGPPRTRPESVSYTGYQAHFFELEKEGDRKIAFRTPTGKSVEIKSKAPQFELVGNRLCDATEKIGPLFGERPPRICAAAKDTWEDIRTMVVGEEGSGKGRWRKVFRPNAGEIQQDLPSEVAGRKGGWYFLRLYDTNDDLIESLDFRFLCALKEIRIPQPPPLPPEDGHNPVRVEFFHDPGCAVQPVGSPANIQIERQDDKTILTVPPDPTYDETRWLGLEGRSQVEVTILVERLWWGIGEERNAPSEWEDQPFTLPRDDFAATSKKALWLRLPTRRWVDKVLVGFEQPKARPYDVKVTEKTIAVPFREFGDSKEVGDRTQEHFLKVWIERDGRFMEGVVAVIPASQLAVAPVAVKVVSPPTPHWVGFGRKKTAVAEAVLQHGSGDIRVNGRPLDDYFKETPPRAKQFLRRLLELDRVRETLSRMEVLITVTGSDPTTTRQAKAVAHALARALMSYDPKLMPSLKQAGFGGVRVKKRPVCNGRGKR
jgi:small subunit ribosomal protein S9